MVGQKSTQTSGRDNNRQGAPYILILFSNNTVSMKKRVGMHLVCYYPYQSCSCTFLILPSLLTSIIKLGLYIPLALVSMVITGWYDHIIPPQGYRGMIWSYHPSDPHGTDTMALHLMTDCSTELCRLLVN